MSPRDEMAIFNVINGKARGLTSSLLDYHTTKLLEDLELFRLDLFIAKRLNDDTASPWHRCICMGGAATQGTARKVSLRGMQSATKLLVERSGLRAAKELTPEDKYIAVRSFWAAVAELWQTAWTQSRNYLLRKGVGVTALSLLAADIITVAFAQSQRLDQALFSTSLARLRHVDWSNHGPFRAYGGRHGADHVHQELKSQLFAPALEFKRAGS